MEYFNLCTKKEFDQGDEKKTIWLPVGTLRKNDNDKMFIELNQQPNETIFVFENKPREMADAAPTGDNVAWDE